MTGEQRLMANRRLRLGITNVGFWVVAAIFGLVALELGAAAGLKAVGFMLLFGEMLLVQAGFDMVGGMVLVPAPRPALREFLKTWGRGFATHSLVLFGLVLLNLVCFQLTYGFCWAVFAGIFLLATNRMNLLWLVAGITLNPANGNGNYWLAANAQDPAFTGGIAGFSTRVRIVIPAGWQNDLPAKELQAELFRRQWQIQNGLPLRSLLLLLAWNLAGCSLGKHLLGLPYRGIYEALLGHVCFMTLWGFLGLLILPKLSHAAVIAADQAAAAAGLDIRSWIKRFPQLTGEDGNERQSVQSIFYPIPATALRLEKLAVAGPQFVPGNLARNNLYYSLATLTLLGRAVHCNAGRPALWVFPPSA